MDSIREAANVMKFMLRTISVKSNAQKSKKRNFNEDVLTNILQRLPLKSLTRFKAVNSHWLSLISSPQFVFSHMNPSIRKYGVIQVENTHTRHPYLSLRILNQNLSSSEVETIHLLNPFGKVDHNTNTDCEFFGSCNGLLLISLGGLRGRFILWNPSTREHKKICRPMYQNFPDCCIAGLGYDYFNDNYKVVIVVSSSFGKFSIEVYNNKTNSWQNKKSLGFPYIFSSNQSGVTLDNGIIHWYVKRQQVDGQEAVLLCFDSAEEKFNEVLLPKCFPKKSCGVVSSLFGKLCVCRTGYGFLHVWKMGEYGEQKSWSKVLDISFPVGRYIPLGFANNIDELVMNLDGKAIAIYNPSRRHFRTVLLSGYQNGSRVVAYVQSLVSISK